MQYTSEVYKLKYVSIAECGSQRVRINVFIPNCD